MEIYIYFPGSADNPALDIRIRHMTETVKVTYRSLVEMDQMTDEKLNRRFGQLTQGLDTLRQVVSETRPGSFC